METGRLHEGLNPFTFNHVICNSDSYLIKNCSSWGGTVIWDTRMDFSLSEVFPHVQVCLNYVNSVDLFNLIFKDILIYEIEIFKY